MALIITSGTRGQKSGRNSKLKASSASVVATAGWYFVSQKYNMADAVYRTEVLQDDTGEVVKKFFPENTSEAYLLALNGVFGERGTYDPQQGIRAFRDGDDLPENLRQGFRTGQVTITEARLADYHEMLTFRSRIVYGRSSYRGTLRTGYGRHVKGRLWANLPWEQQLPFTCKSVAEYLHIEAGVRHSSDAGWYVVEFVIDVDNKDAGEVAANPAEVERHRQERKRDALRVVREIIRPKLPGVYHEVSTGGIGRHVYVQIAYRVPVGNTHTAVLRELVCRFGHFLKLLDEECRARGFSSRIDPRVCGGPSVVQFRENPELPSVWKAVKITRGQCIKMPAFWGGNPARSNQVRCLRYVRCYARASVFFKEVFPQPPDWSSVPDRKPGETINDDSLATTYEVIEALADDHAGFLPNNRPARQAESRRLSTELEEIRQLGNPQRRYRFGQWLARYLGRVPTEAECEYHYVAMRVNQSPQDTQRSADWKEVIRKVGSSYDPQRHLQALPEVFREVREKLVRIVDAVVPPNARACVRKKGKDRKGRPRTSTLRVTSDMLAAALHVLHVNCKNRSRSDSQPIAFLSYDQATAAISELTGKAVQLSHVSLILRVLKDAGIIEQTFLGSKASGRASEYRILVDMPCMLPAEIGQNQADTAPATVGVVGTGTTTNRMAA